MRAHYSRESGDIEPTVCIWCGVEIAPDVTQYTNSANWFCAAIEREKAARATKGISTELGADVIRLLGAAARSKAYPVQCEDCRIQAEYGDRAQDEQWLDEYERGMKGK